MCGCVRGVWRGEREEEEGGEKRGKEEKEEKGEGTCTGENS